MYSHVMSMVMGLDPAQGINEEDLAPLRRAVDILSKIGVSVSDLDFYTDYPNTEFEGPAASVTCALGPMSFEVKYNSNFLQTHLTSVLTSLSGDQSEFTVDEFASWLEENAPVPIRVDQLRDESEWSVSIELEIVMPWEVLESSMIVDGVVVSTPDSAQDDQYSGLSLAEALPVLLDFMSRAQSLEKLPSGVRWSSH